MSFRLETGRRHRDTLRTERIARLPLRRLAVLEMVWRRQPQSKHRLLLLLVEVLRVGEPAVYIWKSEGRAERPAGSLLVGCKRRGWSGNAGTRHVDSGRLWKPTEPRARASVQ